MKALTQFPSVLDNLAKNLAWTSALGEASATQQPDVMAAVQRMRAKALAAGNLKSSPEIKVVQESPQTIVIQPANPQIVYVPVYNPTVIYGAPVVVPGYSSADLAAAAIISFGVGIAVGAMVYGGLLRVGLELLGHQLARQHHNLQSQHLRWEQLLARRLLRWRLSSRIPRVSSGLSRVPSRLSRVWSSSRLSSSRYNPSKSGQSPRLSSSCYNPSCRCGQSPEDSGTRPSGDRPTTLPATPGNRPKQARVHDPAPTKPAVINVHRPLTLVPCNPIVRMRFLDP